MKFIFLIFGFAIVTITAPPVMAAVSVGVSQIEVISATRGKNLPVTIWYPAASDGQKILLGESALFEGSAAFRDSSVAGGQYPLILISHGSGGRIENLGWLATRLVEAGFIVAGPNHPGTTSGNSTPADTPKLWERTQDLTDLIDQLGASSQWGNSIDMKQIGILGFSLGGAAAMQISGAQGDLDAYANYCDAHKAMSDCLWYAGGLGFVDGKEVKVEPVHLRSLDKKRFEQSNLDERIKSAVLVDPALAQAYNPDSIRKIQIPMTFVNLGSAKTVPIGVSAQHISQMTQKGTLTYIDDAVHFSFLAECKKGGAEILKSEGVPEPLCDDGGGRARKDIHVELAEIISNAFLKTLKIAN